MNLKMKVTNQILIEGYEALTEKLGLIDAEKFISYIQREPFDYTLWQENLMEKKLAKDISNEAMNYRKNRLAWFSFLNKG